MKFLLPYGLMLVKQKQIIKNQKMFFLLKNYKKTSWCPGAANNQHLKEIHVVCSEITVTQLMDR